MARASTVHPATDLARRLEAFVTERFPFALAPVRAAFDSCKGAVRGGDAASLDSVRIRFADELRGRLKNVAPTEAFETTPGVEGAQRFQVAIDELVDACDGFLHRAAIRESLTPDERREILRGMVLTRATDNRLKTLFTGGEVRYGDAAFQGKGFRSLGQEAIYAAAIRLRRGKSFSENSAWRGDVIAPLIRDLGAVLAMRSAPETIRAVMSAQMGKAGPPMHGKDLHMGDMSYGILPAAAPLGIGTLTLAGMAFAFARDGSQRVTISFMGEGGTSLGEWHEAINLCAVRRLPMVFCVQNNQTALSTAVRYQSASRVFADKAAGYGIPGITIDGTDPDEIASAFAWAVDRARAGQGPTLIELVAMRMCGHAHHDDMLYLGKDPQLGWEYPPLQESGYANPELYKFWSARDPIPAYATRLQLEGLIDEAELNRLKEESVALVEAQAQAVIAAPWPDPPDAARGVFEGEPPRTRVEVLDPAVRGSRDAVSDLPPLDEGPAFDRKGSTFLEGVMQGVRDGLRADPRVFVFGEDVGGAYGNAFLLLRPLLEELGDRLINSPLAENAVLGVCVGAALAGQRPIGEMQFNDFVATGFNQLVNNAAKIRYRWGGSVPMVVRMPWGGLRSAGPFHSQNTEPWFYRTPGLKIVVPSTPHDARALMASAIADPDPVLYYEHIALYRDPRVKQALGDDPPAPIPIGRAALRRAGADLAIVSYGAFVHTGLRVAGRLAKDGIEASVLDLRSLAPLDRDALFRSVRHCSRVLVIHEDARTGGIGESLAAIIQEEAFEWLDAPVRIVGALDTPVPYSPPLESFYLPSDEEIENAARLLVRY
ncbi:MAG TPA: thiamine pyrophosphate-dependent enzyme [Vicinamibacterales bacterium]|jgi:2-oxoisovalerate dehydrogenase E1 component